MGIPAKPKEKILSLVFVPSDRMKGLSDSIGSMPIASHAFNFRHFRENSPCAFGAETQKSSNIGTFGAPVILQVFHDPLPVFERFLRFGSGRCGFIACFYGVAADVFLPLKRLALLTALANLQLQLFVVRLLVVLDDGGYGTDDAGNDSGTRCS